MLDPKKKVHIVHSEGSRSTEGWPEQDYTEEEFKDT